MSVKVSIIIPVYNTEKYIKKCIDSLLKQTLQECEFIFVNDGSQDQSRQIIQSYIELDSRIILINQENRGASEARNTGLKIASGEYVGFVDADDYVESNMYEILFKIAKQKNADIVISRLVGESEGHKIVTEYPFPTNLVLEKEYIEKDILPYFLKEDDLNTVCTKIFRTEVVKENEIFFPKNVALGEDRLFNIKFLFFASRAIYIDYFGYHYRGVDGSATRNIKDNDYFKTALEVYNLDQSYKYLNSIDKEIAHILKSIKLIKNVMSFIHIYFAPTKDLNFSQRYKYIQNMINNKYVREALPIYCQESYRNTGRYEKIILNLISKRSTIGLYFATTFSRIRNK